MASIGRAARMQRSGRLTPLIGGCVVLFLTALESFAAAAKPIPNVAQTPVQETVERPVQSKDSEFQLEQSWEGLNQQIRKLDEMLAPSPALSPDDDLRTPLIPESLLSPNQPASGPLTPAQARPEPPLALPSSQQLKTNKLRSISLLEALATAFSNNPSLQASRDELNARSAKVAAAAGTYWPRLNLFANLSGFQQTTTTYSPYTNSSYGFGGLFSDNELIPGINENNVSNNTSISGDQVIPTLRQGLELMPAPFYIPAGGGITATSNGGDATAGVELNYDILDFARTPRVRAAEEQLNQQKNAYANQLRVLQLNVSEAYYSLQRAEQLVRIRDAILGTDLVILEDVLNLKEAGLVPRLDLLRRNAVTATDEEALIQALADRAVARRRLWTILNLPADITPVASDPITLQPQWPLDLEGSLLAAYRDNPELEAILATRQALALQQDAVAAQLLPTLSLFASGAGLASIERIFDFTLIGDGCCGASFMPLSQESGYEWSFGLMMKWMFFDAGTTANSVKALAFKEKVAAESYANQRNAIRLRLEEAFFNHEASLAKLISARRGVGASMEAFRDVKLRYQTGLSNEVDLSVTQQQLVTALVQRLNATIDVNITYARMLRELLPVPRNPKEKPTPTLQLNLP